MANIARVLNLGVCLAEGLEEGSTKASDDNEMAGGVREK